MQQPLLLSGKKLTLEQWLENMELDRFKDKFRNMRLGELLSYTDKDINDLCDEFGIKMPFKKRFTDAVHVLQANKESIASPKSNHQNGHISSSLSSNNIISPMTRSIVSMEEETALNSIDERYKNVLQSLTDNQSSIDTLKLTHSACKTEINSTFDEMIKRLNNRRAQLIERLNFEGNKKMKVIKENKEKLQIYKQSIEGCQADANKLCLDVTMDRKTRKYRILQIEKYILKYAQTNNVKLSFKGFVDDNFLKFDAKKQSAKKAFDFLSNFGNILVKEVPSAPMVNVIGIGPNRCKIGFKLESAQDRNALEWIIEYREYQPIKDDEDEEKAMNDFEIESIGSENVWIPKAKIKDVNEYILNGLMPNKSYSVRVCCSNSFGWSDYSKITTFRTKPIEGGIDSKIMNLGEKKKLIQLVADKLDKEMSEEKYHNHEKLPKKRSSKGSFLSGIFGKNKNVFVNEENVTFELLFRGSRDGFSADSFHSKCDHFENTIVVIESAQNKNVFGGFCKKEWTSPKKKFQFVADECAFLFSLRNNHMPKAKGQIFEIKATDIKYAACHDPKYGPIFGNGYSLCLYDRCNEVDSNYSSPVSFAFGDAPNQLSGTYNFTVREYEVFQIKIKQ